MAAKILQLPEYCHLFEDFLVEELIFYKSLFEFHYGKCSVIGKLHLQDNLCYLQNISLSCLDEKYRLQTSKVEIRLLETSYRANPSDLSSFGSNLVNGSFYEVHGETAFLNIHTPNAPPITVAEMIINQRMKNLTFDENVININDKEIPSNSCQLNEVAIQQDVDQFAAIHIPVVQVHTMNAIDHAEELIQCNLQLRLLRKNRQLNNY